MTRQSLLGGEAGRRRVQRPGAALPFGHDGETLTAALFPKSVLFRRVAGVQREWGPLTPLQKLLHFWLSMVTDSLEAPMSLRRAVKQAAKRPL